MRSLIISWSITRISWVVTRVNLHLARQPNLFSVTTLWIIYVTIKCLSRRLRSRDYCRMHHLTPTRRESAELSNERLYLKTITVRRILRLWRLMGRSRCMTTHRSREEKSTRKTWRMFHSKHWSDSGTRWSASSTWRTSKRKTSKFYKRSTTYSCSSIVITSGTKMLNINKIFCIK